jgi:hypothetical protein
MCIVYGGRAFRVNELATVNAEVQTAKFIIWSSVNCVREEIKSRLNSGNARYHSVQSLLSSRLLSRNVKAKIYKTIILPVVCMGVKLGLSR